MNLVDNILDVEIANLRLGFKKSTDVQAVQAVDDVGVIFFQDILEKKKIKVICKNRKVFYY